MKKVLALLFIAVMLLSAIPMGTAQEATSTVTRGGELVIAKSNKMTTFYPPHTNTRVEDGYVYFQIFETLLTYDTSGNIVPCLATEWNFSEDNLHLTFTLRDDVKFHDGTDFNADAVKYILDWYTNPDCAHVYYDRELAYIESIDKVDDYTICINFTKSDAAILSSMAGICGIMLSPASLETYGVEGLAVRAVGTGPFMLEEYVEGDHVTLVRNENYYLIGEDGESLPYLDKLTFRIMTDDSVKTTNLQSGDIDMVDYHSSTNSVMKAQSMAHLTTVQAPNRETYFMCFNLNDEMLANKLVRQAVSYAVNRQELLDVVLEGIGILEPFDTAAEQWYYSDYTPYTYDPEKAKELLTEAGYPDGVTITLSYIAREPDNTMVQLIQEQVKASNITLELESMERLAWIEKIRTNRAGQMGIGVIAIQGLDPNLQLGSTLVYLEQSKIQYYLDLLASAKDVTDQEARKAIIAQFQKEYLDDALHVILGQKPRYVSFTSRLQNMTFLPFGAAMYKYAWLTE